MLAYEWGVRRRVVDELRERCTVLSAPVCKGVDQSRGIVWIHPEVTAEVQYNELMQGRLRDPVLRGVYAAEARRSSAPMVLTRIELALLSMDFSVHTESPM